MGVAPEAISRKVLGIGSKNIILLPSSLSPAIILAHFVLEIFILLFLMIWAPESTTRCGLLLDISPYFTHSYCIFLLLVVALTAVLPSARG
jgi:hypothetical protein